MRLFAAFLAFVATACGDAPGSTMDGLQVSLPWLLSHDSCGGGQPPGGMWATLHIAGGFICDLNVNTAGAASGRCPDVVTGQVRPLAVEYGVQLNGGPDLHDFGIVAYALGKIDLTHDAIGGIGDAPEVYVSIDPTAITTSQSDINAMTPTAGCQDRDRTNERHWLWCYNQDRPNTSLDCDNDSDSNMLEACEGALSCSV